MALKELTRQDSDLSKDQIQVCLGLWTRPLVSPLIQAQCLVGMLHLSGEVLSILVTFLFVSHLRQESDSLHPTLSIICAAHLALAWHGAVLQKELLIPKVLEKLGKKEGNNHPMASDYILYPVGRLYCLTALGELCDFQEEGRESSTSTSMPRPFCGTN